MRCGFFLSLHDIVKAFHRTQNPTCSHGGMATQQGCSGSRGVSGGAAQEVTSHRQHNSKCSWRMPREEDTYTRWACESSFRSGQKRR